MAKKPTEANPDHQPKMPAAVRKQMEEADAIRAEMNKDPNAPAEPADAEQQGQQGAEPAPGEPPAPAPAPTPPPAAAQTPPPAEGDIEQKLRTANGRLEAATRTNQQLMDRLDQMQNLIATMQAAGTQPPAEGATPAPPPKFLTDEERQEYGEDLLNVVGKRAKEEITPEISELSARLAKIEGRVEGVTTLVGGDRKQQMYNKLTEAVPEWRTVNKMEEFKLWLTETDPFSGRIRAELLNEAHSRQETSRVISIFKGYVEAAGLQQDPQARTPSAPPPNGNGSGKPSLEDFAAPGRARSAPPPEPADKPVYTSAQIAKFMGDRLAGKWKGREAQAEAIEQDIFKAQHEGRIQG